MHKKSVNRSPVPPFPQKVTLRLRCSLVNALTTLRLATNFLRVGTTFPYWHLFCSATPVATATANIAHHESGGRYFCARNVISILSKVNNRVSRRANRARGICSLRLSACVYGRRLFHSVNPAAGCRGQNAHLMSWDAFFMSAFWRISFLSLKPERRDMPFVFAICLH